jgi:SAM-dependent methyltransferase
MPAAEQKKEWQGHVGHILDSLNEFNIIDCEKCQFKHAVPIPTEKELLEFYKSEFYSIEKPLYIERMEEDADWWNLCYDERYKSFEKFLPSDRRSILDIGSGPGFFLKRGQERGWTTLGVEPSHQAYDYSTKVLDLNIENGFFNSDMCERLKDFDVIHMSEVLEHIPNPEGLLELVYNKLNLGGLLCIAVPNDYSPFQTAARQTLKYKPWWVGPPQHINYFDFSSLEKILTKYGFTVLLKESTFPIDMFLLMGENYIDNDKVGRKCHGMVKEFEKRIAETGDKSLKNKLYQKFAELNIGREAIIYAQKKDK